MALSIGCSRRALSPTTVCADAEAISGPARGPIRVVEKVASFGPQPDQQRDIGVDAMKAVLTWTTSGGGRDQERPPTPV